MESLRKCVARRQTAKRDGRNIRKLYLNLGARGRVSLKLKSTSRARDRIDSRRRNRQHLTIPLETIDIAVRNVLRGKSVKASSRSIVRPRKSKVPEVVKLTGCRSSIDTVEKIKNGRKRSTHGGVLLDTIGPPIEKDFRDDDDDVCFDRSISRRRHAAFIVESFQHVPIHHGTMAPCGHGTLFRLCIRVLIFYTRLSGWIIRPSFVNARSH